MAIYGRDEDYPARRTRGARQWAQDRRALADALAELPRTIADKLALPEPIPASLERARSTTAPVARKRHLKHLAGLLRLLEEEEIEAIEEALVHGDRASSERGRRAARWRDRLVEEGETAVPELLEAWPQVDVQRLRQALRRARRQEDARAWRMLLEVIKEAMGCPKD